MRLFSALELLDEPQDFCVTGKSYTNISGRTYKGTELKQILEPVINLATYEQVHDQEVACEVFLKMINNTNNLQEAEAKFSRLAPALELLFATVQDSAGFALKQELELDKGITKNLLSYMDDLLEDRREATDLALDSFFDNLDSGVTDALERLAGE